MSETAVTVAPSGGSAPQAAPSSPPQTETPINPNPTSSPTPVGSQAPDKPVGPDFRGSEHRPPSRREALQAAFDKATRQQDGKPPLPDRKPAPKAAEAKPGHNKPPEPTETEKPKLNLKKRPDEQEAQEPQPRDRGRFAPRTQGEAAGQAQNNAAAQAKGMNAAQSSAPVHTLPENAPFREPPQRMAEHARRDWAAAPESVRGEVHRMEQEFAKAYHYYKGSHDAFQPIAHFHKMAIDHGTTLQQALVNYTSMEQKLRADPVAGLDVIVNNLNLKAPNGQKLTFRDIAYHVLQQSPEQLKTLQVSNAQAAASQQIGALHKKIEGLENTLQQWQHAQQFTYTRSQVDQFADSHPRFDELGALIKQELNLGFDLDTAYRRAELLQPATPAPQTRDLPAAQTRAPADKSISGSPGVTGSNPASRRNEKPVGRREAISNAIRRVQGVA